jgi:spore coat polysaccharide biosynthesis protein SpsF (cytidylyltransferase family)
MGSRRLPGKVMLPLAGVPIIEHLLDRMKRVSGLSGVIVATTADPRNNELVAHARHLGALVWREPSEDDLAARLYNAAHAFNADAILKVNADSPLIDPEVLQTLLDTYRSRNVDYATNKIIWSYPKGLSAEVIAVDALAWCNDNLVEASDREYVSDWIKTHNNKFSVASIESGRNLGHFSWMVDTQEEYLLMEKVFKALYTPGKCFGMEDVLTYLNGEIL